MKQPISFVSLTALLILAALAPSVAVAQQSPAYRIVVNGVELPTDEGMQIQSLTLFAPLDRNVVGALGAAVGITPCGAENECFTLSTMGKTVSFTLGDTQLSVDGRTFSASAAPFRDQGVLFLPALNLFEALGAQAVWDEKTGTLTVSTTAAGPSAYESLTSRLKLAEKEKKPAETAAEAATSAETFQTATPRMAYTYDNQIAVRDVSISGDKSLASSEEVGDIYNDFNIRFLGTLRNGYEFQGVLKTSETTDSSKKHGEINKLELGWVKNKISLSLGDVSPKFSKYVFRSYPFQGINYKREGNDFTVTGTFGKAMKKMRSSEYARYLSGVRVEHSYKNPRPHVLGASIARVHDSGSEISTLKMDNLTYEADYYAELKKPWVLKSEIASGHIKFIGADSTDGTARTIELNYINKRVNWRNFYERTSYDFFSESSYFSRGRTEFYSLYNKKMNKKITVGGGYKLKQLGTVKTYTYPTNVQIIPFKKRQTTFYFVRNFEKTISTQGRIRDTREYRWTDMIGDNRLDFSFERRKQKDATEQAYRNLYSLSTVSPITQKMNLELKLKQEKWYHDQVSVTRQQDLKLDYEVAEWTDMVINIGRYYNEPENAYTKLRFGLQKLDIVNDREMTASYEFKNFRDYNIGALEISYSFYK
ncbi:MAG: copper amine oxidase N-terminal domain-containing protein [bacterium]